MPRSRGTGPAILFRNTSDRQQHGKLLAHDWQVEGDNRIGPAEIPLGSLIALRSRLNSTNNRLSGPTLLSLARLDFRLTEMPNGLPSHFPPAPQKLDLQVTRSDKCGRFEVSFANPAGWDLDPTKHQIAFQLFVRDKNGKLVRADRRFLAYRADGRYRECVRVEPRYYDHSRGKRHGLHPTTRQRQVHPRLLLWRRLRLPRSLDRRRRTVGPAAPQGPATL